MREVKKFFHLALHVTDLDKSIDFYKRLGCEYMFTLKLDDGRPWLAYVRLNKDQYLELFQIYEDHPLTPREKKITQESDDFFGHLSFLVPDIYKAAKDWAAAGCPLVYAPFRPEIVPLDDISGVHWAAGAADRNWICWIQDPDGNWIEVMEEREDSYQKVFEETHPW